MLICWESCFSEGERDKGKKLRFFCAKEGFLRKDSKKKKKKTTTASCNKMDENQRQKNQAQKK